MPYNITGSNGEGFTVVNTDTGERKNKKPYKSRGEAVKYMRALYAAEGAGAAKATPKKKVAPELPEEPMAGLPTGGPPGSMSPMGGIPGGGPPMGGIPGLPTGGLPMPVRPRRGGMPMMG